MTREQIRLSPHDRLADGRFDGVPVETSADQGPLGVLRQRVSDLIQSHWDSEMTADEVLVTVLKIIDAEIGVWQLEQTPKPSTPRLAKSASVDLDGFHLDGEPFPWYVSDQGNSITPGQSHGNDQINMVTVRILVDGPVNLARFGPVAPE